MTRYELNFEQFGLLRSERQGMYGHGYVLSPTDHGLVIRDQNDRGRIVATVSEQPNGTWLITPDRRHGAGFAAYLDGFIQNLAQQSQPQYQPQQPLARQDVRPAVRSAQPPQLTQPNQPVRAVSPPPSAQAVEPPPSQSIPAAQPDSAIPSFGERVIRTLAREAGLWWIAQGDLTYSGVSSVLQLMSACGPDLGLSAAERNALSRREQRTIAFAQQLVGTLQELSPNLSPEMSDIHSMTELLDRGGQVVAQRFVDTLRERWREHEEQTAPAVVPRDSHPTDVARHEQASRPPSHPTGHERLAPEGGVLLTPTQYQEFLRQLNQAGYGGYTVDEHRGRISQGGMLAAQIFPIPNEFNPAKPPQEYRVVAINADLGVMAAIHAAQAQVTGGQGRQRATG